MFWIHKYHFHTNSMCVHLRPSKFKTYILNNNRRPSFLTEFLLMDPVKKDGSLLQFKIQSKKIPPVSNRDSTQKATKPVQNPFLFALLDLDSPEN